MATIVDLMNRNVLTVSPETTVAEAATMMGERGMGSTLVMDGEKMVGIFTERDILRAMGGDFDAAKHTVSEWMTAEPITATPATAPDAALKTMLAGGFRHLPVMEGDRVVGVVSMRDLSGLQAEG